MDNRWRQLTMQESQSYSFVVNNIIELGANEETFCDVHSNSEKQIHAQWSVFV